MYRTLRDLTPRDSDYPQRTFELDVLGRVLAGKLYDVLPHAFHDERDHGGEYIPLRKRRPTVRYNLCRVVVEDAVSLLFGDGRFPIIECADEAPRDALVRLIEDANLPGVMNEAVIAGSVGSVAILMRVLGGRVFFEALPTLYLKPEWDPSAPDTLLRVSEKRKVRGDALAAAGYTIAEDKLATEHWFGRIWDAQAETWLLPQPVGAEGSLQADPSRTVWHGLGFVPMVWIRNLPGPSETGAGEDGASTFARAIDTQIELDYQLSQAGRGLKYSSDPTLLIKEPAAGADGEIIKSAGNALVVSEKGDAKLLEIGGTAADAVISYAGTLRDLALESMHGNRASADKLTVAQSGKAMELMHQPLIWLADRMRGPYGDHGLLELLRMVIRARSRMPLRFRDGPMPEFPAGAKVALRWPPWFHPTEQDQLEQAQGLGALRASGLISRETGVKVVAVTHDIPDPAAEIRRIAADEAEQDARAKAQAAQVRGTEPMGG